MSFWQGGSSGWIYLALLAPNFIVSPGLIQKAYGAVDERAIRVGLGAHLARTSRVRDRTPVVRHDRPESTTRTCSTLSTP